MTSSPSGIPLDQRIDDLLGNGGRIFLATSVDGNSSGSAVFYGRDDDDLVFFTFDGSRKAEQIRANRRLQAVIWPDQPDRIRGLRIDGRCRSIEDPREVARARRAILEVTRAFSALMDDSFLIDDRVAGYYRLTPLSVRHIVLALAYVLEGLHA